MENEARQVMLPAASPRRRSARSTVPVPATSASFPPAPIADLLARAGWLTVASRLTSGLTHDLNGRVTSLSGMAQLLGLDDDVRSMAPFLDEEIRRLASSVRLVALLGGELDGEPELLPLDELLESLIELHRRHHGLEGVQIDVEIQGGLEVFAAWALIGRIVLIALAHGGYAALDRAHTLDVHLRRDTAGASRLLIHARGARASHSHAPQGITDPLPLAELAQLLPAGLRVDDTGDSYMLALEFTPTRGTRST